jgi:hypothetical protein
MLLRWVQSERRLNWYVCTLCCVVGKCLVSTPFICTIVSQRL